MEVKAATKTERITPRKVGLIAQIIRKKNVEDALGLLMLIRKRPAKSLYKLLKSAVSNAVNNAKLNKDLLVIKRIEVTPGPMLKRFRASTKGRVHPYKKRSSHIKVILEERRN